MEEWKTIESFPNYEVSSNGQVRRDKRILKQTLQNVGYYLVSLSDGANQKGCLVHRLVASAFILNPQNKRTVNHKDANKLNNTLRNLEWATDLENTRHAIESNLRWHNYFPSRSKEVIGFHIESGITKEFGSLTDACRQIGCKSRNAIQVCLDDPQRTAKGWRFRIPDQK